MDLLYAVSIRGTMLYVKGNLSEQECIAVDTLTKHFTYTNNNQLDYEAICEAFLREVNNSLHISLTQAPLEYVFRIR